MAKSFNKTIIIGHLGQDPEFKEKNDTAYTNFSLSQSIVHKNGETETQWHRVCAFGKQAHICHKHLKKGDLCCIEGRLDSQSYEKNGERRYRQSIIAEKITFLSTRREGDIPVKDHNSMNIDIDQVFTA